MKLDLKLSRRESLLGDDPEKLAKKLSSLSSATEDQEERESCLRKFTSCRWVIGYMCCAARFAQSAIRQCIGLAVVCMTLHSGTHVADPTVATGVFGQGGNETWEDGVANSSGEAEVTVAEFVWSPQYEGLILNGFNIGFLFSPILGGHIAGRFGGKRVVAVALLGGGLTTIFLPMAARCNDIFVIILRITTGMFLGAVDPAIQALWAKWAPKQEKAQLTTCSYTGLSLAGVLTFFVSGYLCDIDIDNGWPFIFYFFGMFALLCLPPWMLLVYDSPAQHPRILDNEVLLICRSKTATQTKQKKLKTPWRGMMTSTAFWAIIVAHVTYTWVTSWMMSYLPKYLKEKMKFDIKENGLYSSLPYVGRLLSGFLAGYLSDFITSRNKFTTAKTRKIFQVVGCIGCAVCMQAVGFLDHTWRGAAVVLLVLAISFQNLTSVAFRINHLDIAPRFAGVMMGMTVTAAMLISLTGPPITAAIIKTQHTMREKLAQEQAEEEVHSQESWLAVFSIVAALNVLGAVIFALLAKGTVQDWAKVTKDEDDEIRIVTVDSGVDILSVDSSRKDSVTPTGSLYVPPVETSDRDKSGSETETEVPLGRAQKRRSIGRLSFGKLAYYDHDTDSGHSSADEGYCRRSSDEETGSLEDNASLDPSNRRDAAVHESAALVPSDAKRELPKMVQVAKRPLSKTLSMPLVRHPIHKNILRKRISSSDLQNQAKDSNKTERHSGMLTEVKESQRNGKHPDIEESTRL